MKFMYLHKTDDYLYSIDTDSKEECEKFLLDFGNDKVVHTFRNEPSFSPFGRDSLGFKCGKNFVLGAVQLAMEHHNRKK